jgi:ATP synthase protein I
MGVELISATLTWAGIGWLVDRWLGTAPWFLAIGALVGNAAGIYLIWLRGARMDAADADRASRDAT